MPNKRNLTTCIGGGGVLRFGGRESDDFELLRGKANWSSHEEDDEPKHIKSMTIGATPCGVRKSNEATRGLYALSQTRVDATS